MLTKYLAEEGERSLISGACAISNPFDFTTGWKHIRRNLFGFYEKVLTEVWVQKYKEHLDTFLQSEHAEDIDFKEAVTHANTFCQFDLMVTCKLYGYKSLNEYY